MWHRTLHPPNRLPVKTEVLPTQRLAVGLGMSMVSMKPKPTSTQLYVLRKIYANLLYIDVYFDFLVIYVCVYTGRKMYVSWIGPDWPLKQGI